jgi:hypothetical protein|nr:MAG TPA: hypothetical protein [Caudoviricetes sp.]
MAKTKLNVPIHDIHVNQGDTYTMQVVIKDEQKNPVDVRSDIFVFKVREVATSNDVLVEATCTPDNINIGQVNIVIDSDSMSQIPTDGEYYAEVSSYYYDIQRIHGDNKTRIIQGKFIVSPGISFH